MDKVEDVILAMCDRSCIDDLVKSLGESVEEELFSSIFGNKYRNFIEKSLPNGENMQKWMMNLKHLWKN